jgi:UDP-2,3-diacylglucosamine hydrolase
MASFFIADLHLSSKNPELTSGFEDFTQILLPGDNLYILGDLFDYYIGINPQDETQLKLRNIIKKLSNKNINVLFIHGNRDFLFSPTDAKYFGLKLLKDITVIKEYGHEIVLIHGDEICPEKTGYKLFRLFSRIRFFQIIFYLLTSQKQRNNIALNMRKNSQLKFQKRNCQKVKISITKALTLLHKKNTQLIIHGHTHNASRTKVDSCEIYDTGNWHETGYSYVMHTENKGLEIFFKNL